MASTNRAASPPASLRQQHGAQAATHPTGTATRSVQGWHSDTRWHSDGHTPAAPVWPVVALIPVTVHAALGVSSTAEREPASIGSPSFVPVPCKAQRLICSSAVPAARRESRYRTCCADPFGAVITAVRPSWRTVAPPTERAGLHVGNADSVTARHASPKTIPSARWSHV